jgi:hypothetical protein
MADYQQWNESIIRFHTRNVPKGGSIYLTVNEDSISMIGKAMLGINSKDEACTDFLEAVKDACIRNRLINLDGFEGIDEESELPKGVAFLSCMVLAAHKMSGKGGIDHTNYFMRLRELLGLDDGGQGRPEGLGVGHEEPLWRSWRRWLETNGWTNTAESGTEGPMRYISYPIGQALLRDDDAEYLKRKYRTELSESMAFKGYDEAQLAGWLLRHRINRSHLRSGFESPDPNRSSAFFDEAYKVYQSLDWDGEIVNGELDVVRSKKIIAGILYQPSMRSGLDYRLLPRVPAHWQGEHMAVVSPSGERMSFERGRTGLFKPLWHASPFSAQDGQGQSFAVEGSDCFEEVILPARRFWLLTPDPEDEERGALATWEKYPSLMGKKFLLLVEGGLDGLLASQMMKYRNSSLVEWDKGPIEKDGWTEFHGCMVLSASWDSIIPDEGSEELHEALKPAMRATIALSGGLRAPGQGAWLEGFPPLVTIYGFEREFTLRVTKHGNIIDEGPCLAQTPFSLDACASPALYRLEVLWGHKIVAGRAMRVTTWEGLEASPVDCAKWSGSGAVKVSGPRIVVEKAVGNG